MITAADETPARPVAPGRLPALAVGTVAGLVAVTVVLSLATLVYSGEASVHLGTGAALFLLGASVMNLVMSRWTSLPGSVVGPQDATTAVAAVTVGGLLPAVAVEDHLGTIVVFMLIASAVTGACMFLLGAFRLGDMIRFVPYPVIGGFLAGTGWLLVVGAADLVTGGFDWSATSALALTGSVVFAVTLVVALRFRPSATLLPITLVAGLALFYAVLLASGMSIGEGRAAGLLPTLPETSFALRSVPGGVDWAAIGSGVGGLLTISLVANLAVLLNVTGLELISESDADLNRELRATGGANLAAAVTGTPVGYHYLSVSALGYRLGVVSRGVTVLVGVICLMGVFGATALMSFLPTPVAAGLLLLIGLGFLVDWLVDGIRRMTTPEYLLMLAIVVAVAAFGFLVAVLLGMAAAVVLFVVAYSHVDPVRFVTTGREHRSSVVRTPRQEEILQRHGEEILVMELQGYLFFGTARAVVGRVTERGLEGLRCLVLDARRVHGVDSTGLASFVKLARLGRDHAFPVLLSDVPAGVARALQRAVPPGGEPWRFVDDLDYALEQAENVVLESADDAGLATLAEQMGQETWDKLAGYLVERAYDAGATIVEYGDPSAGLYLVATGRVAAEIPTDDGRWRRVRSSGPGTILGEMSLYRRGGRTARLRAEEPTRLHLLDAAAFEDLERADPATAVRLHRLLAGIVTERLSLSNQTVSSLLR